MNNISYIAAVDPGNEKTGVAILSQAGELIYRTIVETKTFNSSFESILSTYLVYIISYVVMVPIISICIHLYNKLGAIIKLRRV